MFKAVKKFRFIVCIKKCYAAKHETLNITEKHLVCRETSIRCVMLLSSDQTSDKNQGAWCTCGILVHQEHFFNVGRKDGDNFGENLLDNLPTIRAPVNNKSEASSLEEIYISSTVAQPNSYLVIMQTPVQSDDQEIELQFCNKSNLNLIVYTVWGAAAGICR